MEQEWFSTKEVVDKVKIPATNIGRYKDQFPQFVETKKVGNKIKYAGSSLRILEKIYFLFSEGKYKTEIEEILAKEETQFVDLSSNSEKNQITTIEPLLNQEDIKTVLVAQGLVLQTIADNLNKISEQNDRISKLEETIAKLLDEKQNKQVVKWWDFFKIKIF